MKSEKFENHSTEVTIALTKKVLESWLQRPLAAECFSFSAKII
jgi:hypothetical protein